MPTVPANSSRSRSKSQRPGPNLARRDIELDVLRKLRLIFSSAKKHFRFVEQRCGVSGSQLWALIELRDHPGIKVSELARLMSVHLSTASNLLDKMETRGLMRRERTDSDQRVVRLYLTAAGKRVVVRAPEPARGVVPDAIGSISPTALRELHKGLRQLAAHLKIRDVAATNKPLADI
jgi:DNA-binding MarR family transcriptional regulator